MFSCVVVGLLALLSQAHGHMALQEPPSRNVLWRMGYNHLPPHLDDDYLICTQQPGAPCPPCGDAAELPSPRPHEGGGGVWATGIIGRTYTMGQTIPVTVNVTRSHGGVIEFRLCPHNNPNKPVSQRCLDQYPLAVVGQRSRRVRISAPYNRQQLVTVKVKLPNGVSCNQCVLQMTNIAEEFKPQTIMFRNCADISIQGTAKTNMAAGAPEAFPPSDLVIHTRSGGVQFPDQKQYRFYN